MEADLPFDRRLRRLRRDRAARTFADASYLHARAVDEVIARLNFVTRGFSNALLIGAAAPGLVPHLRELGTASTLLDPGHAFAAATGGIQSDEDRPAFGSAKFDLVLAVGTLDTVNDLPGALALIRRYLRPDGLLLAAFAGAGTLPRLRSAMIAADEAEGRGSAARLHPQIDARAAGDLLARAGFALPVVDTDAVTVRFGALGDLVRDLRAMAGTNVLAQRGPPIGRRGLAAARADFAAAADGDGRVAERFELLYLTGWSPSPDQPQPARRGSATSSLAAALKPRR